MLLKEAGAHAATWKWFSHWQYKERTVYVWRLSQVSEEFLKLRVISNIIYLCIQTADCGLLMLRLDRKGKKTPGERVIYSSLKILHMFPSRRPTQASSAWQSTRTSGCPSTALKWLRYTRGRNATKFLLTSSPSLTTPTTTWWWVRRGRCNGWGEGR